MIFCEGLHVFIIVLVCVCVCKASYGSEMLIGSELVSLLHFQV